MSEPVSREVYFLRQVAKQQYSPDFTQNLVQVNNTLKAVSKYLITMQQGIDDLNRDILEVIQDFIDEIIIIFTGGTPGGSGFEWGDLHYIIEAIGRFFGFNGGPIAGIVDLVAMAANALTEFFFPTGLLNWLSDITSALEQAFRDFAETVSGTPVIGGALEDAFNAVADFIGGIDTTAQNAQTTANTALDSADAAQNQVVTIQQIFSVRSNRPLWEGVDPTGESTFPFALLAKPQLHTHTADTSSAGSHSGHTTTGGSSGGSHSHSVTVDAAGFSYVSATASLVPGGCIRCESPNEKKQITIQCYKTGTVSAFYLDLYKMNTDGSWTLKHSTASKHAELLTSIAWMQWEITPYLTELGDVIGIQFRVGGTGTVFISGVELPSATALPGFRPNNIGFVRTTNSAPSTISTAEMDAAYSAYTPYIQIGSDVGQLNAPRNFYDNANRSTGVGANWAQFSTWGSFSTITSNQFTYNGTTDGWQGDLYVLPLATDKIFLEMDVVSTSDISSLIICSNNTFTNNYALDVTSSGCTLYTATALNAGTSRASSGTGGTGRYRLTYTPADKTVRFYKQISGVWTSLGSWADSGDIVTHGAGKRFAGRKFRRNFFANGGPVDNWNSWDEAA